MGGPTAQVCPNYVRSTREKEFIIAGEKEKGKLLD